MSAFIYYFNGSNSLLKSLIKSIIAIAISVSKRNEDYCTAGELCPGNSLYQERSQNGNIAKEYFKLLHAS